MHPSFAIYPLLTLRHFYIIIKLLTVVLCPKTSCTTEIKQPPIFDTYILTAMCTDVLYGIR